MGPWANATVDTVAAAYWTMVPFPRWVRRGTMGHACATGRLGLVRGGAGACLVAVRRGARYCRRCDGARRAVHRAGRGDRRLLDRPRAAGEDRACPPSSAARRHHDALPAVARLRRLALAARLAVGLHQADRLSHGLWHRQARRLLRRDGRETSRRDAVA